MNVIYGKEDIRNALLNFEEPCCFAYINSRAGLVENDCLNPEQTNSHYQAVYLSPLKPSCFGSASFLDCYGIQFAYYAGSMAYGISSEKMVISLGKEKILASFGAGGLNLDRIANAVASLKTELSGYPYAFNLIHSPFEGDLEEKTVKLYLDNQVKIIEASAYINLTPSIVQYRILGLSVLPDGRIFSRNKIIAKISRKEIALKFLQPPPENIVRALLNQNKITEKQAKLSAEIPMADDITVEANSGGHTDNGILICILPEIINLRKNIQDRYQYKIPVRIGAAGGISTPHSALSSFVMGAEYIVTGSVNQTCVEAGTSDYAREILGKATSSDTCMAPSAIMFELGAKEQVLKNKTMYPMNANKLNEIYKRYSSIDDIPLSERNRLEKQIFKKTLHEIWDDVSQFFSAGDPGKLKKAESDPKYKMALVFRWYLGKSVHWAINNTRQREMDYKIYCGPSIGPFNEWLKGTYLEAYQNRSVVDVAYHIMNGAAYLYRVYHLKMQGINLDPELYTYIPKPNREKN